MASNEVIRENLAEVRKCLDQLLARFHAALTDPSSADIDTATAFAALARGVRKQLRHEDEVILAGLAVDLDEPAIASVRREHEPLRALLAEIDQGLHQLRGVGVLGNTRELAAALALHQQHLDALVASRSAG